MDHPHPNQEPGEALIAQERWAMEPGLEGLAQEIAGLLKGRDDFEAAQTLIARLGERAENLHTAQCDPQHTKLLLTPHCYLMRQLHRSLLSQGYGLGQILLLHMVVLNELFAQATEAQRGPR